MLNCQLVLTNVEMELLIGRQNHGIICIALFGLVVSFGFIFNTHLYY